MKTSPLSAGLFRFSLIVTEEIALPPYKGFAFRGVFGTVLKELACVLPEESCQRCPFRQTCTYAYLFETSPAEGVDGFRRFSNFPRPYIIRPPQGDKRLFRRYDPLEFEFILIGRASECIPQVILTFDEIGQRGIRNGQGRYIIDRVTATDEKGVEKTIYEKGRAEDGPFPLRTIRFGKQRAEVGAVTLNFHTPLLIEERGKVQYEPPRFSLLFENLVRRIMLLQAVHGTGGLDFKNYEELVEKSESVRMTSSDMQWNTMERISNRQMARIKTGGLTGSVTYSGELKEFIPFLKAGEIIHVGKSTTFGFGGYRLQKA